MESNILPLFQHLWLSLQTALTIVLSFGFSLISQLLQTIIVTWVLQQWADWRVREAFPVIFPREGEVIARNSRQGRSKTRGLPASLLSEQFLTVFPALHVPE